MGGGLHVGATWWIRLNNTCTIVKQPYVKLFRPLVLLTYFIRRAVDKRKRISRKHWTACSLCGSLPVSFLSSGCLIGWCEWRQSISSCRRRTVILVNVRFGAGLDHRNIHYILTLSMIGQFSLLPSVEWEMSTSQTTVKPCDREVKASMVHSTHW